MAKHPNALPQLTREEMTPPPIQPVPAGVKRPRWSVMIPTYNCAAYLYKTLESVLAQDPGPSQMQIEVVDDCSTEDDPEAVTREVGKGRVSFYRKPTNQGAIANFNTCIERSVGKLIHILHGDDWVKLGYYDTIQRLHIDFPDVALYATRVFFTDQDGTITQVSPKFDSVKITKLQIPSDFWLKNPLQFAGVTLQRSFLEANGGFINNLVHVADWEMWLRAFCRGSGIISPYVMGYYRQFEGNDTSRLRKSGDNLKDYYKLYLILKETNLAFPEASFKNMLRYQALTQWLYFKSLKDATAAYSNYCLWSMIATPRQKLAFYVKSALGKLFSKIT